MWESVSLDLILRCQIFNMLEQIKKLRAEIEHFQAKNQATLEEFRQKFIAKKGVLAMLFVGLKKVEPGEKKELGLILNELKSTAQEKFKLLIEQVNTASQTTEQLAEDLTLPPPSGMLGTLHPLTSIGNDIIVLFEKIGFNISEGPEIEDDWHNFTALNFPDNHPARDMQDTFFVAAHRSLRTHTSSVQVRVMEGRPLPIRTIAAGRVFRNEAISARAHCMFHQIEGLYINQDVSFAELKETLLYFVKELFGSNTKLRFRPSYFPFTEPSAELDIDCRICRGKGCNICKYTGWVEIMGAGMVDPQVLTNCNIDPEVYTGFAFGMGIERIAMLQYQINDLRLFTENDMSFLKQF
ncbi:MAG: phenylalanine--tRNA ligase subunit alpha [Bacteroidota bacterium]